MQTTTTNGTCCTRVSCQHTDAHLQVNPLAETKDGKLIAADAKLGFDDNAAFRQKELMSLRDTSQEDPRCLPAPTPLRGIATSETLLALLTV